MHLLDSEQWTAQEDENISHRLIFISFVFVPRSNSSTTRVGRFLHKERALKIYTDDDKPSS